MSYTKIDNLKMKLANKDESAEKKCKRMMLHMERKANVKGVI